MSFFINLIRGVIKMTIGEALKEEQKRLGLTSEAMAAGVITKGTYSKVVNGKLRLSSDLLVEILFKHNIDISDFFEMIKSTYMPKEKLIEEKLFSEMQQALNNHEVEKAEECLTKIKNQTSNKYLQQRAEITVAYLTNSTDKLSKNFKQAVVDELNNHSNWVKDLDALRLFNTALLILSSEKVEIEMNLFFIKLNRIKKISEQMEERYAILCCNYLDWKYRQQGEVNDNVKNALKYLSDLKLTAHFESYKVCGKYFGYLFNKEIDSAKNMRKSLLALGITVGVENWPV